MTASEVTSHSRAALERSLALLYDDTVHAESEECRIESDMKACSNGLRAYIRTALLPNARPATTHRLSSMAGPFLDDAALRLITASERHARGIFLRLLHNAHLESLRERLLAYVASADISHFPVDFQGSVRAYLELEKELRFQQILVQEYDTLEKLLATLKCLDRTERFATESQQVLSEATATKERTITMWKTWVDRLLVARGPRS